MTNPFEELVKDQVPKEVKEKVVAKGLIWINILVEYDLDGNCKILRSFSKPAKESEIKGIVKDKKKFDKLKIDTETEHKSEELFE